MAGVGIVPFMVGLFAISQIIRDVTEPSIKVRPNFNIRGTGVRWSEFAGNIRNMLRSTAIGVGIGILPGIGGSASNLVSYGAARQERSEEHTSELQSLMRLSKAVFCLKKKKI